MITSMVRSGYVVSALALLVASSAVLVLTLLKETPLFWMNEGGYPLWLRAFVLHFYYPVLGLLVAGICAGAVFSLQLTLQRRYAEALFCLLALAPGCAVLLVSLGILVANNVANLLQGLPLHHH